MQQDMFKNGRYETVPSLKIGLKQLLTDKKLAFLWGDEAVLLAADSPCDFIPMRRPFLKAYTGLMTKKNNSYMPLFNY